MWMTNKSNNKDIIYRTDHHRVYVVAEVYLEWMLDQLHPVTILRAPTVN
jgi:hypothetical protein